MALDLCDCRQEHRPGLEQFFARVYCPDYILVKNQRFFRWQFGEDESPCFKLAVEDGRVVGCLGYIPATVNFGDERRSGAWTANWMVAPDYRGRAIGPLLMRALMNEFDVTLAVGLSDDARRFLPKLGWSDIGRLRRAVCVLDHKSTARLTSNGRITWPALPRCRPTCEPSVSETSVRHLDRFDQSVTEFWDARLRRQPEFAGARRDAAALNRRYVDHPEFQYRLFEVRQQGRMAGFAVYRVEDVRDLPLRVGRIVELFADGECQEPLLSALLEDARGREVACVDFYRMSSRIDEALRRTGFVSDSNVTVQVPNLFQPLCREQTDIHFMAYLDRAALSRSVCDWYVTKSDGDQDRPN